MPVKAPSWKLRLRAGRLFLLMAFCSLSATAAAAAHASNTSRTKVGKGFAIYLLTRDVTSGRLSKLDVERSIEKAPIITTADVVAYSRLTHEIELTRAAWHRITGRDLSWLRITSRTEAVRRGVPFALYVDDEPIYLGEFWTYEPSARGDPLPVVAALGMSEARPFIRFALSYVTTPRTTVAVDKRSDPRILRAFESAGRLKEVWSSGGLRAIRDDERQLVVEEQDGEHPGRAKFSLLLRPDGTATYFGLREVEKIGLYSGTYPAEKHRRLGDLLLALEQYDYPDEGVFSQPRLLGIVRHGELKMRPDDFGRTPAGLSSVEKAFNDVTDRIRWTKEAAANSSGIRGTANVSEFGNLGWYVAYYGASVSLAGGQNVLAHQPLTGKGEFQFNLPPGIYAIRGTSGSTNLHAPPLPRARSKFVVVEAGKFTRVTLDFRRY